MYSHTKKQGFTLLELLIVIGILAILGTIVILVLNPAETLRQTRDSQRISDLATIKSALGLYLVSTASPVLGRAGNGPCKDAVATYGSGAKLYYSLSTASTITDTTLDGETVNLTSDQVTAANLNLVDGNGWIPVNLSGLTGGSPIERFPQDPTNTISNLAIVDVTDNVYRYVCEATTLVFEVDANLESTKYAANEGTDGGNNSSLYEAGTNLALLGAGSGAANGF